MPEIRPYRARIRINGRQYEKRFVLKKTKLQWLSEMEKRKDIAKVGLTDGYFPMALEDYCIVWMKDRINEVPLSTYSLEQSRLINYLLPMRGKEPMHTISKMGWEKTLTSIQKAAGLTNSTYNRYRSLIHKIYEDARRHEPPVVMTNPISLVERKREVKKQIQTLESSHQVGSYLQKSYLVSPPYYIAVLLMLNTGMRPGEVYGLRYDRLFLDEGYILVDSTLENKTNRVVVRTKSKRVRKVPLNSHLRSELLTYMKLDTERASDSLIVRWKLAGGRLKNKDRPFNHGNTLKIHKKICKQLGLTATRLHDLRHTYATQYLNAGGSIYDLKWTLGHSSLKVTEGYTHEVGNEIRRKANVYVAGKSSEKVSNEGTVRKI